MKATPRVLFALLAAWSLLALVYIILRPPPNRLLFWLIVIPGVAAGGFYTVLSRRDERREEGKVVAWNAKLAALVDVHDFEDDGHLHEDFTDAERLQVLSELERMPIGARSLKKAIGIVNPAILEEEPNQSPEPMPLKRHGSP